MKKTARNYSVVREAKDKELKNIAFISLGSNKGNRSEFLRKAVQELNNATIKVQNVSSVYETKAFGNRNQRNFLNAVIQVRTSFSYLMLFRFLKYLEIRLGRKESAKWGPREIDLDLLFFNDKIVKSGNLVLPHPGICKRDFVLIPLLEIESDLLHPALNKKITDICTDDISKNIIRKTKIKLK